MTQNRQYCRPKTLKISTLTLKIMNTTAQNNGKSLKVVSKAEQKALSIPTPKAKAPKVTTATKSIGNIVNKAQKLTAPKQAPKPKKEKAPSLHKELLECNALDKKENFSLSGAVNRLKKQIFVNPDYKGIDVNILDNALKFDTILAHVAPRCIEKQRFTVYAVGLAVNKYLKTV